MRSALCRATCILVFCLVALLPAAQARAEEQPTITQTMKLYEGVLVFPPPPWMKTKESIGDANISRRQDKNVFSFEMIPKSQDFESWTSLYGVYAFYLPDYDLKRFIAESLNAMALGCKEQAKSTIAEARDGRVIMTFHCPRLADPMVVNGNDAESGFLCISQVEKTYAKTYLAWRYPAKDIGTDKSPMTKQTIIDAVEDMKKIRFTPVE